MIGHAETTAAHIAYHYTNACATMNVAGSCFGWVHGLVEDAIASYPLYTTISQIVLDTHLDLNDATHALADMHDSGMVTITVSTVQLTPAVTLARLQSDWASLV